jgi:hypothetical protein
MPFQMPTRLADGLGLESGPRHCYQRPFAPSRLLPGLRVPRTGTVEAMPV